MVKHKTETSEMKDIIDETVVKKVAKRHAPYWRHCYPAPMSLGEMASDDWFSAWGAKECHDCAIEAIVESKMDEDGKSEFTMWDVAEALPTYREAFLVEMVRVLAA